MWSSRKALDVQNEVSNQQATSMNLCSNSYYTRAILVSIDMDPFISQLSYSSLGNVSLTGLDESLARFMRYSMFYLFTGNNCFVGFFLGSLFRSVSSRITVSPDKNKPSRGNGGGCNQG